MTKNFKNCLDINYAKIHLNLNPIKSQINNDETYLNYFGDGYLRIKDKKYHIKNIYGILVQFEKNDKIIIGGPLDGILVDKNKSEVKVNLYLILNITDNEIEVTLNNITGNNENIICLAFGDYFPETNYYIEKLNKKILNENKQSNDNVTSLVTTQEIVDITLNDYAYVYNYGYNVGKIEHMGQLKSPSGNNTQIINLKPNPDNAAIAFIKANNIDTSYWSVSAHPDRVYLRITMPTEFDISYYEPLSQQSYETIRIYYWYGGVQWFDISIPLLSIYAEKKSTAGNLFYNQASWVFSEYLGIEEAYWQKGLSGRLKATYNGTTNKSYKVFGAGNVRFSIYKGNKLIWFGYIFLFYPIIRWVYRLLVSKSSVKYLKLW
ncbi:hypothetical protein cpu_25570 [Carboxydothermus pertinax]|uniref:Uncharacterized protein n=1 Tax=Carboxydothermus pertinax TaxID=870242 RepID=A0A1L8CYS8_9THEO|nr:hypothetical protein cpu_25570 [Carboxydothermus pertinax]